MKLIKAAAMAVIVAGGIASAPSRAQLPGGSFDGCLTWCDENVPYPLSHNSLCKAQCGKDYPQSGSKQSNGQLGKLD